MVVTDPAVPALDTAVNVTGPAAAPLAIVMGSIATPVESVLATQLPPVPLGEATALPPVTVKVTGAPLTALLLTSVKRACKLVSAPCAAAVFSAVNVPSEVPLFIVTVLVAPPEHVTPVVLLGQSRKLTLKVAA